MLQTHKVHCDASNPTLQRNLGSSFSWTSANSSWSIFTFGCSILLFKRCRSGNCNCFTFLPASATTTTGLDGVSASIVPLKAVKIQTATMRMPLLDSIGIRLRGQSTNPPEMGAGWTEYFATGKGTCNSKSKTYKSVWIWAFGATPAIAPVAPSASSGWKLVMKVGSQTDKLGFSSALWTNHELLNQNSPIQDSTDAKYAACMNVPFKENPHGYGKSKPPKSKLVPFGRLKIRWHAEVLAKIICLGNLGPKWGQGFSTPKGFGQETEPNPKDVFHVATAFWLEGTATTYLEKSQKI